MISKDKENAKKDIADLVNRLEQVIESGKEATFSEADVSSKFILPFLDALGWDTKNIDQVKEQRRTLSGPVDYTLFVDRKPRLLLEVKKFVEQLDGYREVHGRRERFPEQATRYAWHMKVEWVVLTNFKEIRLYNSYYSKPIDGLRLRLRFPQFVSEFDKLWILSLESVRAGELDKIEKKAERKNIDEAVLEDLLKIRRLLSDNISSSNPSLPIETVGENVRKIMERLIVIRVAEDKGLIGFESLRKELESWKSRELPTPFMRSLKSLFRDFDDIYNTKLFEQHNCEDLSIENKVLETIIDLLYQYNFDLISADVLGAIYEDYLGHVLQETTSGGVQVIESGEARKKEGIYYTPTHLVEYVVRETLGEILQRCESPDDVAKIKILDPACGSGSFLIKAFDTIKEWYENYNSKLDAEGKNLDEYFKKITDIEYRILADNLFGVDIDPEAAEIASVNLMLKAMKREEKLPKILGHNIRVGNSLVNGSEEGFSSLPPEAREGLRPFVWEQEFRDVFTHGGFDVVIGNPPYYKIRKTNPIRISRSFEMVKTGPVNVAMMFIDQAIRLARTGGKVGLVLPKMLTYTKGWEGSRKIVFANQVESIIDCQEAFEKVLLEQILLVLTKTRPEESNEYRVGEAKGLDITISPKHIAQNLAQKEDFLFIEPSDVAYRIREKMLNGSLLLENVCDIILGLGIQSFSCWHDTPKPGDLSILRGDDIQMWHIRSYLYFSPSTPEMKPYSANIASLRVPHIVAQRIVAHIRHPRPHIILMAAYDTKGSFAFNTVVHFLLKDTRFDYRYILGLLNSKLFSFYAYKFIYNNAIRSMDFYKDYSGRLPVRLLSTKDQKEILDVVDSIIAHFQDPRRINPIYEKYMTEKVIGFKEFRDYYRALSPSERDPKDQETEGIVEKLIVRDEGDWLSFKVDYLDQKQHRIINGYEVLRCKIKDREIRTFLLNEINSRGPPNRGKRLFDKILSAKLPYFHKDANRDKELIIAQLRPFLNDVESHNAWKSEYRSLDDRLNKLIYQIYELDEEEVKHVEENSRPSGWLAEETT